MGLSRFRKHQQYLQYQFEYINSFIKCRCLNFPDNSISCKKDVASLTKCVYQIEKSAICIEFICSTTITNENFYLTIIIFESLTVIIVFLFRMLFFCFLILFSTFLDFCSDFFQMPFAQKYYTVHNIHMLITVFQQFSELAFSLSWRLFSLFQKPYFVCINKPTTRICSHQEGLHQIRVP